MNRVDRASLVLVSLLLGAIMVGVGSTVGATHPVPDFIRHPPTPGIRESQIRQILHAMEVAVVHKDVDGILKYMASKITIKVTIQLGAGSQTLNLTRSQYRQYLQQGFEITERYSGKYTNLKIKIAPDGKTATASYTLVEEATLNGQPGTFISTAQETVKFERVQGQLLETSATSNAAIEVK